MENAGSSTAHNAGERSHVENLSSEFGPIMSKGIMPRLFAESRVLELASLMDELSGHSRGHRRVFQLLPKHMRRRKMSHDARRVPRRVREAHKREMAKFPKVNPQKKPSRKHRRRPKNLLLEYNRRQRTHIWLETHIWHAKRFAMSKKWGYKLPVHPNDKGVRPAYRAFTKHCLLQDISYWCCIQLSGEEKQLLAGFKRITNPECGPTIGARMYIDGDREGDVMIYSSGKYPYGALGAVRFIWEPRLSKGLLQSEERKIWLWLHPMCYQDIVKEITDEFELRPVEKSDGAFECLDKLKNGKGHMKKLIPRMEAFYERTPLYESEDGTVSLLLLKDTMVRLKLIGPTSSSVLGDALVPMSLELSSTQVEGNEVPWWEKITSNGDVVNNMKLQYETWNILKTQSPTEVPPNCVLGLVVRDPRISLPKTKINLSAKPEGLSPKLGESLSNLPFGASWSPIWEQSVREEVTFNKMSEQELNKLRSTQLVPGSDLTALNRDSKVPILLIQRPGLRSSCQGLGSGWDIVAPSGWAMAFWIALVYRGARVGGLREDDALSIEQGIPRFPTDFPDTKAGVEYSAITKTEMMEKYFKYPPNKRPNYFKLGAVAAFCCPWAQLADHWSSNIDEIPIAKKRKMKKVETDSDVQASNKGFYVLRDRKMLRSLESLLELHNSKQKRHAMELTVDMNDGRCLVAVKLEMKSKGWPSPFSMICLPKPNDQSTKSLPIKEEACVDTQKESRQALNKKAKLDAVRRKRSARKARKENKKKSKKPLQVATIDPALLEKLHFPDIEERLRSNSKDIIGFVTDGGFSFTHGYGAGFGFVVLPAIQHILASGQNKQLCLVRAPNSDTYQFARISLAK